jgi:hypothetical protein|tara:strand:+ start:175 stop:531 length:357 start_codon:yes stop_codon:yes gene_type:complete
MEDTNTDRPRIYERNPDTGVTRWRYMGEGLEDYNWPDYGNIIKENNMEVTTNNYKENSMNLLSLTEKEIAQLIESLAKNPEIKEDEKSPTLNWLREQLSEQKIGGAWKRRLREKGHVI